MRKPLITAMAAMTLCGMVWAAHANPLVNTVGALPRVFSPIEKIGCKKAGRDCPKSYQLGRYGQCMSCSTGQPLYGSRQGDYGLRRYRDYDQGDYEPRRYRHYDDEEYYEPRRYRRDY